MKIEFSIIIPVYRGEKTLDELCDRIRKVFKNITENYEIILVDDASPDDSWQVMLKLQAHDSRIKLIQLMRNFGQHQALLCGLKYSSGDFVITMDDDLQHFPEDIPELIGAIKDSNNKNDVIIGAYIYKQHSWLRNIGSKFINISTSYIFKKDLNLKLTSFRIMSRSIVNELIKNKSPSPRINLILLTITRRINNIPIHHMARKYGYSGYAFSRLISNTLDNILTYSSLPLRLVSYMGFISSFISISLAFFYLYKYFYIGVGVAGWMTTILVLLFCFGILLFSIGIIGEYLIRILREVNNQPQFIIREKYF